MRPSWILPLLGAAALAILLAPDAAAEPAIVDVELHVVGFGNFDSGKGTYTMDFYLHFASDNGTDPTRFEFVNGRATSLDLLSDEVAGGRRDVWYRIQADLYTDPRFEDYPYDTQVLWLGIEDAVHPADELQYRVSTASLDPEVDVAGWRIDGEEAQVISKEYGFDEPETYSRLTYSVQVSRAPVSATLRSFLPPLAFVLVASFSFFLDPAQPVPRLTLGTGMLISAVGFHLSQTVGLPAPSTLTPFDVAMIATYAFIASCIFVTVALAWGDKLRLPPGILKLTNRWGAALAFALPLLLIVVLRLV